MSGLSVITFLQPKTPIERLVMFRYLRMERARVEHHEVWANARYRSEIEIAGREYEEAIASYNATVDHYGVSAFERTF